MSEEHQADAEAEGRAGYPIGHPWHYLAQGDGAEPPAVEDIEAMQEDGRSFRLPRDAERRKEMLRALAGGGARAA